MDNNLKQSKITKFLQDESMSRAVYESVAESFSKDTGERDVQVLAAKQLALIYLAKAWKDIERFKIELDKEKSKFNQVGL